MKYLIVFVQQDGTPKIEVQDLEDKETVNVPRLMEQTARLMGQTGDQLLILMTIDQWQKALPQILATLSDGDKTPAGAEKPDHPHTPPHLD